MNFSELEALMSSRGINALADIARTLETTPQAVSNWKARDQIPYHIIAKLNKITSINNPLSSVQSQSPQLTPHYSAINIEEDTISLSDILITMAEQLKVILLIPFITIFFTFTYNKFIQKPLYESSATILLPENTTVLSGIAGLASQFGVNVPQGGKTDLSSPSLFPDLITSRTFAERILDKSFYTAAYGRELPLLAILTYGEDAPKLGRDTLIQNAVGAFRGMVTFGNEGPFSVLTIKAGEPRFACDLNKVVLDELQEIHRFFKSRQLNEKTSFIVNRIKSVEDDLERSEQTLKSFREQNLQISSPSLQLTQERLTRDVEIQKNIFLTLKQQLELAKIEEVQEASVIQILDGPQVPLRPSNKNLKLNILMAGIVGLGLGILLGFIRSYANNSDVTERRKLRRVRNFIKKKGGEVILDRRISAIVSLVLIIGLPYYLGHESKNPVFFDRYSTTALLVNIAYVLVLIISISLFIYHTRKKALAKK